MVHTKVVVEEWWSFIRGTKQCKPKHVSAGIVVLNVRWSLIRVVSQEEDYCTIFRDPTFPFPRKTDGIHGKRCLKRKTIRGVLIMWVCLSPCPCGLQSLESKKEKYLWEKNLVTTGI